MGEKSSGEKGTTRVENTELSNKSGLDVSIVNRKASVGMGEKSGREKSNNSRLDVSIVTRKAPVEMNENSIEENDTNRMEIKLDELRMKWAGSSYEIVLEKLDMLEIWKNPEVETNVKEALLDWMLENEESTLMEEGEDILVGLEMMTESGDILESLLLDCIEMITTLIVARNLDNEEVMSTFQKAGNQNSRKKLTRQSRAGNMSNIRKEFMSLINNRKPVSVRSWSDESFQDLEIKRPQEESLPEGWTARELCKDRWKKSSSRTE